MDNCRHENEGIPEAFPLYFLSPEDRVDELWVDELIRIFSDGSVDYPADFRLSRVGAGIFFWKNHPHNAANIVFGKFINSYRAELQAVPINLQGTIKRVTKIWITLDNEAVFKDINAMLIKG